MAKSETQKRLARAYAGEEAGKPQVRAVRHDGWTDECREIFLETLAETCNVTEAARAAGRSKKTAYGLRNRDPGFREGWAEALAWGYDRLELAMLNRAINGTPRPVIRGNKEIATVTHYSDAVGLRLLQAHREAALRVREGGACDPEEAFEELKRRLAEMHSRLKEGGEKGSEEQSGEGGGGE